MSSKIKSAFDERDVYLSHHKFQVVSKPFPHFQISNFLPLETYDILTQSFPERKYFDFARADGNLLVGDEQAEVYLAKHPVWRKFVAILSSQKFLDDAVMTLGRETFLRARGPLGFVPMRMKEPDIRSSMFASEIEMKIRFSRFDSGASLHPHTDQPSTVFSFLLYFTPPGWKSEYGGATEIYVPKNPNLHHNWSNNHLPFDAVDIVDTSDHQGNTLFGFCKSAYSWHGVSPINCPENLSRKALIVTYHLTQEMQRRVFYRGVNSLYRRIERPRFRKFGYLE